jgi:Transposase DDE domain
MAIRQSVHVVTTERHYKGKVYRSHLLRRSFREEGKVKKETVANLTPLGDEVVELIRGVLRGKQVAPVEETFESVRSPHHGHVEAVRIAMRRLGFDKLIAARRSPERDRVEALVVARVLEPSSKLATTRWWHNTTLPAVLNVADADEDDLYAAMDWLLDRQERIEKKLAGRHLKEGGLVLYDLSSSYFEGATCPLAAFGHNRDGKRGKLQVNYGLLTDERGCPISVSVFEGNQSDSKTLMQQVDTMRIRFGIDTLVLVGDRGMISQKQIDKDLRDLDGVDWITALKSPSIRKLIDGGAIQLGLFDERNLFELTHPDFPGERLVACRNPELAKLRAHKRQSLLEATTQALTKIRTQVERARLRGKDKIRARVGQVVSQKLAECLVLDIGDDSFDFRVVNKEAATQAALDSICKKLERIRLDVERRKLHGEDRIKVRLGRVADKGLAEHFVFEIRDHDFRFHIVNKEAVAQAALDSLCTRLESICSDVKLGKHGGKDQIGVRVGKVIDRHKVAKHFVLEIRDDGFDFHVDEKKVASEAALDGIYVIRTSLPENRLSADDTVRSYKSLSQVERAFRSFKTIDLKVRPIHHRLETRVRAHIFLTMLAYYVEWSMREAWRPLLFCDEDQQAKKTRDPVAPAKRSKAAQRKAYSKKLNDGTVVHSFQTLLKGLSTIVRNVCRIPGAGPDAPTFHVVTTPDPAQKRAYDLLETIRV